jgi:hypothetical protein
MPKKTRRSGREPDLETNIAPDLLRDDLRRRDQRQTPDESMPPRVDDHSSEEAVGGGFTPKVDGGNEQHPIHDEDQEDAAPEDYEQEIDRLDDANRSRSR